MLPTTVPASTEPPSLTAMHDKTPVTGDRISCVTLSVSISTKGSSALTGSPTRLNHRPMYKVDPAIRSAALNIRYHLIGP